MISLLCQKAIAPRRDGFFFFALNLRTKQRNTLLQKKVRSETMAKDQRPAGKEYKGEIDPDKVAEKPSTLPYAHHAASAVIKPIDKKGLKGSSLAIMEEQTQMQLDQIQEQVALLIHQAQKIRGRAELGQMIYDAEMNFMPVVGDTYHLYERENGRKVLSMIGPNEWGRRKCTLGKHLSTVRLLSDRTWIPIEDNKQGFDPAQEV